MNKSEGEWAHTGHTEFHLGEKMEGLHSSLVRICYGLTFFAHLNVCSLNSRVIQSSRR